MHRPMVFIFHCERWLRALRIHVASSTTIVIAISSSNSTLSQEQCVWLRTVFSHLSFCGNIATWEEWCLWRPARSDCFADSHESCRAAASATSNLHSIDCWVSVGRITLVTYDGSGSCSASMSQSRSIGPARTPETCSWGGTVDIVRKLEKRQE